MERGLSEVAKKVFRYHALRRLLSMAVLALIDATALSLCIMVPAYLAGFDWEAASYLPIALVVGLALFAAHDLYHRAAAQRNPGAVMWWHQD